MHQQYIDVKCVVALLSKWFDENTKEKMIIKPFLLDKIRSSLTKVSMSIIMLVLFYHGPRTMNMNNMAIATIFKYNKFMVDYSKNTDGGSGDKSEIVIWQNCNDVTFDNYDQKVKNSIYLTIVHMWS